MKKLFLLLALFTVVFSCKKEDVKDLKPAVVILKSVTLVKYPATNLGQNWDDFSQYADPYFEIIGQNSNVLYTSTYVDEANPNLPLYWQVNYIFSPDDYCTIIFSDFDSAANDSTIGAILFSAYIEGGGLPTTVVKTDGEMQVQLSIGYE